MLRFFRVRALCLATAVFLVVGTAGGSLELVLHGDAAHHGDPCVRIVVQHDESAHRFTASTGDRSPDTATHCVACHLARTPRLGTVAAAFAPRLDEPQLLRAVTFTGPTLAPALAHRHPRSPPRVA